MSHEESALRQFKHNDGSPGFILAYDMDIIDKEIKCLKTDAGLVDIELNHTKTLLDSCEKALADRDVKMEAKDKAIIKLIKLFDSVLEDAAFKFGYNDDEVEYELDQIRKLLTKENEGGDHLNRIKAEAIEEARLSLIISSPAKPEKTYLDGADWAFEIISKQLERRVAELLTKDKDRESEKNTIGNIIK